MLINWLTTSLVQDGNPRRLSNWPGLDGISAMLTFYQAAVRSLLNQGDFPGVSAEELELFKSQFRTSAFTCRLNSCPRATLGFESEKLRLEHELAHVRFRCTFPGCKYPLFVSAQSLRNHLNKYHNPNLPRKSIRQVGHISTTRSGNAASLVTLQQDQMLNKGMPNPSGPQSQGSSMIAPGQGDGGIATHHNTGDMGGAKGMRPGTGNKILDYQLQLMLNEQQHKKRLIMARQEQDNMGGMSQEGSGGSGPNLLPDKGMPNLSGPQSQGSPMMAPDQGSSGIATHYNTRGIGGAKDIQQGIGRLPSFSSNFSDDQMQLALREQQDKKRLMMACQEQDNMGGMSQEGSGGSGPNLLPDKGMPNPSGPQSQGSPMMAPDQGGSGIATHYNTRGIGGAKDMQPGIGRLPSFSSNFSDDQMQLALREQQDKKKLMMASQEQDNMGGMPKEGPGGSGPNLLPNKDMSNPSSPQSEGSSIIALWEGASGIAIDYDTGGMGVIKKKFQQKPQSTTQSTIKKHLQAYTTQQKIDIVAWSKYSHFS